MRLLFTWWVKAIAVVVLALGAWALWPADSADTPGDLVSGDGGTVGTQVAGTQLERFVDPGSAGGPEAGGETASELVEVDGSQSGSETQTDTIRLLLWLLAGLTAAFLVAFGVITSPRRRERELSRSR